jgi:two-component system, NtrC family, sensor kinase
VAKSLPATGGFCLFFGAEPETSEKKSQLSYRMASVGQFAAGIAHEVNNPLAYAMGNLSFAIEQLQGLTDRAPELSVVLLALRDALEGAERVRRTVRDLKMFARPDSDRQTPVDVERAIRAAVSIATVTIRHRANLLLDCPPVDPARANESQLAHVFLNLLLNAAYSIPEGDLRNHEIRIKARNAPPDKVAVEITVAGPRVVTEAAGEVLDSFPVSRFFEGGRFAVAVCQRLVDDFGGQLLSESEPGRTSTFRVLIPVAEQRPDSLPVARGGSGARQRARVLVVDDEPRIGSAITRILNPVHEVTSVYTAQDAISRFEQGEEYDVILCDILMPHLSGYDLYQSLAQIAPQSLDRIIFMTGGPFSTRGASFLDTVTNPRLEKPFSPEALRTLVQRSLS